MTKDLLYFIPGRKPTPDYNFAYAGTLQMEEGSTVDDVRRQAASCRLWSGVGLTINIYVVLLILCGFLWFLPNHPDSVAVQRGN
jgi:hypothetical protein